MERKGRMPDQGLNGLKKVCSSVSTLDNRLKKGKSRSRPHSHRV